MIDLFNLFIYLITNIVNFEIFKYCFLLLFISSLFTFVRWRLL